jgi:hypothetical protein
VTIGRDQLRALAVVRYWLGDVEVLEVVDTPAAAGPPPEQPVLFTAVTDSSDRPLGQMQPSRRTAW